MIPGIYRGGQTSAPPHTCLASSENEDQPGAAGTGARTVLPPWPGQRKPARTGGDEGGKRRSPLNGRQAWTVCKKGSSARGRRRSRPRGSGRRGNEGNTSNNGGHNAGSEVALCYPARRPGVLDWKTSACVLGRPSGPTPGPTSPDEHKTAAGERAAVSRGRPPSRAAYPPTCRLIASVILCVHFSKGARSRPSSNRRALGSVPE